MKCARRSGRRSLRGRQVREEILLRPEPAFGDNVCGVNGFFSDADRPLINKMGQRVEHQPTQKTPFLVIHDTITRGAKIPKIRRSDPRRCFVNITPMKSVANGREKDT